MLLFLCIITNFVKAAMQAANPAVQYSYTFTNHAFTHTKQNKRQQMINLVNQEHTAWRLPSKGQRKDMGCRGACDTHIHDWDNYKRQFVFPVTNEMFALMNTNERIGGNFVCILSDGTINHIGPFQAQPTQNRMTCFLCLIEKGGKDVVFKVKPNANSLPSAVPVYNVEVASKIDSFVGKDWVMMTFAAFTFGIIVLLYCERSKEEADLYSALADLEEVE